MSFLYKTILDVKILHEYYLTDKDGNSIFGKALQKDRLDYLTNEFDLGRPSINQDLSYEFPAYLKDHYDELGVKLIPAYSGFKLVLRVTPITLPDDSLVFQPFHSLPDNIFISIVKRNSAFDSYTQSLFKESLPLRYLFSNEDLTTSRSFPFLTNEVSSLDPGKDYQQGELVSFAPNDIREFYPQLPAGQFTSVVGSAFANENDLVLLPSQFSYSLSASGITAADFELKNGGGTVVKTISIPTTTQRYVVLDFSDQPDIFSTPDAGSLVGKFYTLNISGSGTFSETRRVAFSNNLYNNNSVGVIHIAVKPSSSAFNLLATDGFLIRRRNPLGIWTDAPVVELPFKGRSAFWRYLNDQGKKILPTPDHTGYFLPVNDYLISHRPLAISRYHFIIQKEGSSDTKYFPNPVNYDLKKDPDERLCFDIRVPASKLFPV